MDSIALAAAVSSFGERAKAKFAATISGEPEEQLRNPLELLVSDCTPVVGIDTAGVAIIGETSLTDLKTRPDFAVTYRGALVGFIEVKAPGKGADPRHFQGHDKDQWHRLKALPNLIYTDGNTFSLWHDGELQGSIVHLDGNVETSGANLAAPDELGSLFSNFFHWDPTPPRQVSDLATLTARLCRLLRDEVREQLGDEGSKDSPLEWLAKDWRALLFPTANNSQVADGYAQTVTFGLLLARSRGIDLTDGIQTAASELGHSHSLIGTALRVLTDPAVADDALMTSVMTMRRVLNAVNWSKVTKDDANAWLYFYEGFLQEYDPKLRRSTGTYYTPIEVVSGMTKLVDDVLVSEFGRSSGLADQSVTVLDPAVGTGTFLIAVLEQVARHVRSDLGPGAVGTAITESLERVIGFELQLGPFAVAQVRMLAELAELGSDAPPSKLRMYVTNTLGNPYIEQQELGAVYEPIAQSRREANKIKSSESIFVVLGNPPWRPRSKGLGGWIESGNIAAGQTAPLDDFMPPKEWGLGAHTKHLRDTYVYFWRWATWKVFDDLRGDDQGVVCFITAAGFLDGPGFERMRKYLRERCDQIWVIDASPEGHQPPVGTRIFQGVQQPACIVLAVRTKATDDTTPAKLHYRELPSGSRTVKFEALAQLSLDDGWTEGSSGWRDEFRPMVRRKWSSYVPLDQLCWWNGSGVMPGRSWVVAPDSKNLTDRWNILKKASLDQQRVFFSEHSDRRVDAKLTGGLPGFPYRAVSVHDDQDDCQTPIRYGYRSFDRQWVIPDKRLINRPNPTLWKLRTDDQVYMTGFDRVVPGAGPAVTFSALIPDIHHFRGNFGGRVFPMWADAESTAPNVAPGLLSLLSARFGIQVSGPDVMAYIAGLLAHPGFLREVADEFSSPGIRVPLTGSGDLFTECALLGRRVIWIHTYGERFSDPDDGRYKGAPRMASGAAPLVVTAIPSTAEGMPEELSFNEETGVLSVGAGRVANVTAAMWNYQVSGVNVLHKWFSYRKRDRERPVIGERRVSPLTKTHSDHWLAEYTAELIDLLNVLGLLIELEPRQEELLQRVMSGQLIEWSDLDKSLGNSAVSKHELPAAGLKQDSDTLF